MPKLDIRSNSCFCFRYLYNQTLEGSFSAVLKPFSSQENWQHQLMEQLWRVRSLLYQREVQLASDFKCPDRGKRKGNFEVPFSRFPELFRARSRLYRSKILQVNTRWKALVEIYTMHSFAPFFNLKIFVKNRWKFRWFLQILRKFPEFCWILTKF